VKYDFTFVLLRNIVTFIYLLMVVTYTITWWAMNPRTYPPPCTYKGRGVI